MHLLYWLLFSFRTYHVLAVEPSIDCPNGTEMHSRNKRIIYGTPLTDTNSYDVVGYHVHISRASGYSWAWYNLKRSLSLGLSDPSPPVGLQICGGVLLTENIVQTACHCVANKWTKPPNWEPRYEFPITKNGWEDLLVIHHGFTKVTDFKDGVWSERFVVHLECKKYSRIPYISHDFALILTRKPLPVLSHIKNNFAPLYSEVELAMQYYSTMKRQAVCLKIGYGYYYYIDRKRGIRGPSSPVLMHGWRSVSNYWECWTYVSLGKKDFRYKKIYGTTDDDALLFGNLFEDYPHVCTWVCTQFFGRQRAIGAPGDSGSPMTCSNQYFGVMSANRGRFGHNTNISVDFDDAIAFNMVDNAVEYRVSMMAGIYKMARLNKERPPQIKNPATIDPYSPDSFYQQRYAHNTNPHFFESMLTNGNIRCTSSVVNLVFLFLTISILQQDL